MSGILKYITRLMLVLWVSIVSALAADEQQPSPVLTHADAAVILAKYSGFFDRYVTADASLNDCVGFLNKTGIYFGLMEVLDRKEFTRHDFARVMGQMALVFDGEAEYDGGKVKLPNGIASWEAFCTMNEINFIEGYQSMLEKFQMMAGKRDE